MYHLIIVEDDPMVASIHQSYLQSFPDFSVDSCFSGGKEAMSFLEEHPVDLAIVDYYMPEMNGLMFLKALRERQMSTQVIMVTAAAGADTLYETMQYGVLDYIVKPFTRERFSEAMEKFRNTREKLRSSGMLSQAEIDEIMHMGKPAAGRTVPEIPKGIQEGTLNLLRDYLKAHSETYLSCNEAASALDLSRITVRRYMNYLLENKEVTSRIDYTTGGRPSILYRILH